MTPTDSRQKRLTGNAQRKDSGKWYDKLYKNTETPCTVGLPGWCFNAEPAKKSEKLMKNFAITGIAGYIAPRHLKAIKETGNKLVAAIDPHDSVGILDSYFPESSFFTEFERFDRHLEMLRRANRGKVKLSYITTRGNWYRYSWKGDSERSGGITTNIGIHFFDLLIWLFGDVQESKVYIHDEQKAGGFLELEKANVGWFLSLDPKDLPRSGNNNHNDFLNGANKYRRTELEQSGTRKTFRSITIDGKEIEFSDGFTDLHTRVYEEILAGRGFGIEDARPSIELVHSIRNTKASRNEQCHISSLALEKQESTPFELLRIT